MRSERNNKENQTAKVGAKRKGGKEKGLKRNRGKEGRNELLSPTMGFVEGEW